MPSAPASIPSLIHWHRHCDNGLYPDSAFYALAGVGLNHITSYRRKVLFQRTCAIGSPGGTSGTAWRWYCRTGHSARRVGVLAVLGLDDRNLAADPRIDVTLTQVGGSALPTLAFYGGLSTVAAVDVPDEYVTLTQFVDVSPLTEYTGAVAFFDNARVVSLLVYEEEVLSVDDYSPAAGAPIFDSRIGAQLTTTGSVLRYGGGLRYDWSRVDGTARTRTSATLINIVDNSSTGTPSASTPGPTFNTSGRRTISKNQCNIRMAVYGSSAGSGVVRLRDTSGADAAVVTVSGALGWYTASGAMTIGTAQKYDLMLAGDGVNALSVYAVSYYEEG